MKLKTLKDFNLKDMIVINYGKGDSKSLDKDIKELFRQEAIKDIKEFEKGFKENSNFNSEGNPLLVLQFNLPNQGLINYIKWKFNITEEDLKKLCAFCNKPIKDDKPHFKCLNSKEARKFKSKGGNQDGT